MKKIIKQMLLAVVVLGVTVALPSCGSDDDEPKGMVETGTAVNPLNVFTGGLPKSVNGLMIKTNAKGQVESIKKGTTSITFEYKDVATRAGETPNVIMTIDYEDEKLVNNLYLNKNGFVIHCDETAYYKDNSSQESTWDFTYNSDGQLLTMLRSEGGNEKTTIKYQGGDIVETSTVSADEPDESNSYKIYYTSSTISSPIENKGCMMLFDATLGIDMDEMKYAYYAGMLGKATRHLPLRIVENDNDETVFSWKFNAQNYPVSLEYSDETYLFIW